MIIVSVASVFSLIHLGILNADTLQVNSINQIGLKGKSFSAVGIVSDVTGSSISINNASGSNDKTQTSYAFDTTSVSRMETSERVLISLLDIGIGDKVVVQGKEINNLIILNRIISFGNVVAEVATSTDAIATSTASSTEQSIVSTSTLSSASTSTSTIDASNATTTSSGIVDKIKDIVSDVIDFVTGSSTDAVISSSTESSTSTASSTEGSTNASSSDTKVDAAPATSTEPTAATPPTSSEQEKPATDTPTILDKITDAIKDGFNAVLGNDKTGTTEGSSQTNIVNQSTETPAVTAPASAPASDNTAPVVTQ